MGIDDPFEQEEVRLFIDTFVDKKMEHYFDVDRWIIDYQFNFVEDEFILNIVSEVSYYEMQHSTSFEPI